MNKPTPKSKFYWAIRLRLLNELKDFISPTEEYWKRHNECINALYYHDTNRNENNDTISP